MLARMNSVALITGASRGIGRGIALELARLGWDLVVNYARDAAAAKKTAAQSEGLAKAQGKSIQTAICQANIAKRADRERLLAFTRERFHRIDLLVNNAGIAPETRADLLDVSEESFDRLLEVNAKGAFFLTQLAAKQMVE